MLYIYISIRMAYIYIHTHFVFFILHYITSLYVTVTLYATHNFEYIYITHANLGYILC